MNPLDTQRFDAVTTDEMLGRINELEGQRRCLRRRMRYAIWSVRLLCVAVPFGVMKIARWADVFDRVGLYGIWVPLCCAAVVAAFGFDCKLKVDRIDSALVILRDMLRDRGVEDDTNPLPE